MFIDILKDCHLQDQCKEGSKRMRIKIEDKNVAFVLTRAWMQMQMA